MLSFFSILSKNISIFKHYNQFEKIEKLFSNYPLILIPCHEVFDFLHDSSNISLIKHLTTLFLKTFPINYGASRLKQSQDSHWRSSSLDATAVSNSTSVICVRVQVQFTCLKFLKLSKCLFTQCRRTLWGAFFCFGNFGVPKSCMMNRGLS